VTLARWRVPRGGAGGDDSDPERRRALPGRVPFVVPPTATKSAYLANLVIRELWRRAQEALGHATRVIIVGYSVPLEDHVAAGLLADTLADRDVEVVIADPCAEQVASRLRELGVRIAPDATSFTGEDCVTQPAAWWLGEQASAVIGQLRALAAAQSITDSSANAALTLAWGLGKSGRCEATGAEDDSSGPVAALARVEATDLLLCASPGAPGASDDITGLLRRVEAKPGARRILIEADGSRFPVIEVIDPPTDRLHLARFLMLVSSRHALG